MFYSDTENPEHADNLQKFVKNGDFSANFHKTLTAQAFYSTEKIQYRVA